MLALVLPGTAAGRSKVLAIHFTAEVNPVTQDWVNHQLAHAQDHGYSAAVIVVDTPGGLEESMRKIVQRELSLRIPVIVYVSPNGARAASAGVWISEAADLLAMAPQTNIGSSTPINGSGANIGSDLRRKVVNDAAASPGSGSGSSIRASSSRAPSGRSAWCAPCSASPSCRSPGPG